MTVVAGTGHRPDKLGGYTTVVADQLRYLCIKELSNLPNVKKVLSGMALGYDQALAEAAMQLGIPFVAYLPFIGQEDLWPASSQERYRNLLRHADEVVVVEIGPYAPWKMFKRNFAMVDNSDILLALWNGDKSGGTWNCVEYAQKKQRKIENCWTRWQLLQKS